MVTRFDTIECCKSQRAMLSLPNFLKTKTMKLLTVSLSMLVFLSLAMFSSCTKSFSHDLVHQGELSEIEALEEFAIVLSDAIADDEEMRAFIKESALNQYDKDFDVFYPYVKDHIFSSGKTFRQLISLHQTYEGQLAAIEKAAPKLTILVPDFSWLDSNLFCASSWDTSNSFLCVGFDDKQDVHRLYSDGELLGELSASSFPTFPVLIIKSNERMTVVSTKSGENHYVFSDPTFDGGSNTKGFFKDHDEGYMNNPEGAFWEMDLFSRIGNTIESDELSTISPSLIQAYNEFQEGSDRGVQRDYVYYGMTKQNSSEGKLNVFMRDMLYRFRLTPDALFFIANAYDDGDPRLDKFETKKRNDRPGFNEVLSRLWGNGKFEIRIQFFQSYPSSGASAVGGATLSLAPQEVLRVNKMYFVWDWGWFSEKSVFTITESDIESKWYYPGDQNNPLPLINTSWNLATTSDNLYIQVMEYDPDITDVKSYERTFKRSNSVSVKGDGTVIKIGLGLTGSHGEEEEYSEKITVTTTKKSDDLQDCSMSYADNYIVHHDNDGNYVLNSWGNEYFSVSFLPVDNRNIYQIQQFLLGRKERQAPHRTY